jgi:hypothetical protein
MAQRQMALRDSRVELERLVRRLCCVDDGIVALTRRELTARIRETLATLGAAAAACLGPEIDRGPGDRRLVATFGRLSADLEAALGVIDRTSTRTPEWKAAAQSVRERLAAVVEGGLEPIVARAERRYGRFWVDHVAKAARERETKATAPLPKAA